MLGLFIPTLREKLAIVREFVFAKIDADLAFAIRLQETNALDRAPRHFEKLIHRVRCVLQTLGSRVEAVDLAVGR